ncbi:MAG: CoA transferase, partial [Chloroflexi bacterium]|nr:CoA transferase [Chloroflexota bacterium]
ARLLADAGADVVKVEPPGGDSARKVGPFPGGVDDPDWSGLFLYLNANKRGISLDFSEKDQLEDFKRLAAQVDVLVLDRRAVEIDALGLRREDLKGANQGLIVTAITPFGLTGPHRDYLGDDLIFVSAGGLAYATPGVPDTIHDPEQEPPLRANAYVGDFLAGVQAAAATMAAVLCRSITGEGCEVDLSRQEAVAMVLPFELAHASHHEAKKREPTIFGAMPNAYLPCKDGYVFIFASEPHMWEGLVKAMGEPEWAKAEIFKGHYRERTRYGPEIYAMMQEWLDVTGKEEIFQACQENRVPSTAVYNMAEVLRNTHLR